MESKILKLVDEYEVEIELKYKKKSIVAIIDNGDEIKVIKLGFINNIIEEIDKVCKVMLKDKIKKDKELTERLNKIDKTIFPDNLFEK